jgi:hypothetical protein
MLAERIEAQESAGSRPEKELPEVKKVLLYGISPAERPGEFHRG